MTTQNNEFREELLITQPQYHEFPVCRESDSRHEKRFRHLQVGPFESENVSCERLGDESGELLGGPLRDTDGAKLSDPFSLALNPAVGHSSDQHWENR